MGLMRRMIRPFGDKSKKPRKTFLGFSEKLAATYSRRSYTTTTIGNAAFDGRVRNGIGSDHSFKATKNFIKEQSARCRAVTKVGPAFL